VATVQVPCCHPTAPGEQRCWLTWDRGLSQLLPSDLMRSAAQRRSGCPLFSTLASDRLWPGHRSRLGCWQGLPWWLSPTGAEATLGRSRGARAGARGGTAQAERAANPVATRTSRS